MLEYVDGEQPDDLETIKLKDLYNSQDESDLDTVEPLEFPAIYLDALSSADDELGYSSSSSCSDDDNKSR